MNALQITLNVILVIAVIVAVAALITYLVRKKYYNQIDELDQQKKEVLDHAPYDELKEVSELSISGQSAELRKKLERQWKNIESVKYPQLENYLFDAEQATDRYRLTESKRNQDAATKALEEIRNEISELKGALTELIEREQANLKNIDEIKKRYHEVRKSLLAYSFSFGPASESFEQKLNMMEHDFTEFSEHTVSGDHEEASEVVERLTKNIQTTEEQMEQIPPLLTQLTEIYDEQLEDLRQGYINMIENKYLFPNDTILEDVSSLEEDKGDIFEHIRVLQLEEAHAKTDQLGEDIEKMYQRMEVEIEAEPEVAELMEQTKRAVYFLQEENRRLNAMAKRLEQSYVYIHNEPAILARLEEQAMATRKEYDHLGDRIIGHTIPYSVALTELEDVFNQFAQLNDEYKRVASYLDSYRQEEIKLKNSMNAMEQSLYEMKRALENERLPGLPNDYLELFFSTSDRIETLSVELSRPKIILTDVQRVHKMCEEDVIQLSQMTEDLIKDVNLIELTSQRLYRHKDTHKGVLETIRYSESLFNEDYDYDTALRLLREKLENVAPGSFAEIVTQYETEQNQESSL